MLTISFLIHETSEHVYKMKKKNIQRKNEKKKIALNIQKVYISR